MEPNFQTSFIPKKPIVNERANYSRPVSIWLIVSVFILFVVLAGTGGLYFYKGIVAKNISDMQNTLSLAQARFEPAVITQLQTLDKRLRASTEILSKHMTVAPIFAALEQVTMKTVRYTKFSYTIGAKTIDVQMSGMAVGYRSVALQSDLFAQNKNFINPIFSNLALDTNGNVIFDLAFSVDPAFVNYKQTVLTAATPTQ